MTAGQLSLCLHDPERVAVAINPRRRVTRAWQAQCPYCFERGPTRYFPTQATEDMRAHAPICPTRHRYEEDCRPRTAAIS